VPVTDDPLADLFAMAQVTRRVARENPHLYDLMFGLCTRRATYRPLPDSDVRLMDALRPSAAPTLTPSKRARGSSALAGSDNKNPTL
jgi:hypothetical protein